MAWGKTVGVASWVERLKANDASLTSVTVFRGRLFGPDEAAAVSAALRTNTHLLELYASGHAMDAATAATLAEALAENTTLQSLCVGDDAFGDAGLAALAPGVAKSTSLRSLDLENKGIGDAGAAALGDALATARSGGHPSLRAINLSRNAALGPEGLAAVCAGAKTLANLQKLILRDLNASGVAADAVAELVASARRLAVLDLSGATLDVAAGDVARLRAGLDRRHISARAGDGDGEMSDDPEPLAPSWTASRSGTAAPSAPPAAPKTAAPRDVSARRACLCADAPSARTARARSRARASPRRRRSFCGRTRWETPARARWRRRSRRTKPFRLCRRWTWDATASAPAARRRWRAARAACATCLCSGTRPWATKGLMAFAAGDAETSQALSALRSLDLGGCGADEAGLVAFAEALAGDAARLPRLETLVVGGNPGTQGDAWEPALERLRETRPGLDVAWRAADAGENPETEEMRANLLAGGAGGGAPTLTP